MGDIVDLDAYRVAQQRRRSEEAQRKARSRALAERGECGHAQPSNVKPSTVKPGNAKPDAEPVKDDPA
jgi:hypothetical protein